MNKRMQGLLIAAAALLPAMVSGETWNCRNPDIEVSCGDGSCSAVEDGFTPMSVAFNDDGSLSVCAYSGCWEGTGEVFRTAGFLGVAGADLTYSPDATGEMRQDLAILLDLQDGVALLKMGVFAQPLLCETLNSE